MEKALTDGYTTGNGLGLGLAGPNGSANEFEIIFPPGEGTRVTITRWKLGNMLVSTLDRVDPRTDEVGGAPRRTGPRIGSIFDERWPRSVALVVTEAANNLLKHAARRAGDTPPPFGDRAGDRETGAGQRPGNRRCRHLFQDGYSTAGSPGTGLGASHACRAAMRSTRA